MFAYLILGVFSTDIGSLIQAIVTDIIVAALMLSIYIVSISRMVKNFPQNNPMAADAIDIFSFDDERINIETSGELQNGTIEFSYDIFFNVYETKDSFYLYNSNLTAYLLPKSDFTTMHIDTFLFQIKQHGHKEILIQDNESQL